MKPDLTYKIFNDHDNSLCIVDSKENRVIATLSCYDEFGYAKLWVNIGTWGNSFVSKPITFDNQTCYEFTITKVKEDETQHLDVKVE